MKNVLIIGSADSHGKNDISLLTEQLKTRVGSEINIEKTTYGNLFFDISHTKVKVFDTVSGVELSSYDHVLGFNWYKSSEEQPLRDIAFTLALYFKKNKVSFWNSEMINQRSTTKLSAMMQLALNGIDVPRSLFCLDRDELLKRSELLGNEMIIKAVAASRGSDNYLVSNKAELTNRAKSISKAFMLQEFISNSYDIRAVCFGEDPVLFIKRSRNSESTHLNNTTTGASAEIVSKEEINPEILTKAADIIKITNREMAGIDFIVANDGSQRVPCLEVNAIPQLTSGSFTSEKYDALSRKLQQILG